MALDPRKIGVASVDIGRFTSTTLTGYSAVTLSVSAVGEGTAGDFLVADSRYPLEASVDYQFMVAPMGYQSNKKGGYSVARASGASGIVQVTAGQGIRLTIPAANLPSGASNAICMVIFGRKGTNTDYQLWDFAYIAPGVDFEYVTTTEPLAQAMTKTVAILQSTTSDVDLGDRTPLTNVYDAVGVTQGGVDINFNSTNASIDQDNAPQYNYALTRAEGLSFQAVTADLRQIIQATAGNYTKATIGGKVYEFGNRALGTAQAVLKGNSPVRYVMPGDSNGPGETIVMLNCIPENQEALTIATRKDAPVTIPYKIQAAPQDKMLRNIHGVVAYRRY